MTKTSKRCAVFFDRDGTLILDKGYLHRPEEVEYFPEVPKAIEVIHQKNYLMFIVTNQSGVGRGYFPEGEILKVHQRMVQDFESFGPFPIQDLAYCTALPESDHPDRKPNPGMLLHLAKKWNLDLTQSVMIGDKESDAQAGERAGAKGVILRGAHSSYPSYPDLLSFAEDLPKKDL